MVRKPPGPRSRLAFGTRTGVLVACVAIGGGAAACGAILGVEDGVLETDGGLDGGDATVEAQVDAPQVDAPQVDAPQVDAPQVDASGCSGRTVDDATGVFVTLYGADGPSCGTRAAPCLTVQEGINQAQLLGRSTVYVARGTYTESVTVGSGITIEGGWDTVNSTWVPICGVDELSAVALQMPAGAGVVVTASSGATGVGLHLLSVLATAQAAQPGQSLYGVLAQNAAVTLDSVVVTMGSGGEGAGGNVGGVGSTGATGCAAASGATGAVAGDAPQSAPGTFGASGYVASTGLAGASDGGTGTSGTCALSPSCVTVCGTCQSICPNPTSGCGGGPGSGGSGGQGGGSSIAVYGWNAQLTIIGGSFTAGNGGNGGNGGDGGPGGAGGAGSTNQVGCLASCTDAGCATVGDTTIAAAGNGGAGGAGGHGGGGAGGFSYAVYAGGDAGTLALESSPALSHGTAGQGGVVNGVAGQAANQGP